MHFVALRCLHLTLPCAQALREWQRRRVASAQASRGQTGRRLMSKQEVIDTNQNGAAVDGVGGSAVGGAAVGGNTSAPCCPPSTPEPGRAARCAGRSMGPACGRLLAWCPVGCGRCAVCAGHPLFALYARVYAQHKRRRGVAGSRAATAAPRDHTESVVSDLCGEGSGQKGLLERRKFGNCSATWRLCVPRHRVSGWPGTGRWLVAYAHPTNGLANRLAGLRASFALARQSGRQLAVRWFGHSRQEAAFLVPASAQWRWTDTRAPGVMDGADSAVMDAWAVTRLMWNRDDFVQWQGSKWSVERWTDVGGMLSARGMADGRRSRRVCVRTLRDPFPTNRRHRDEIRAFATHALQSRESVLVTSKLFSDVLHPLASQASLTLPIAYRYR